MSTVAIVVVTILAVLLLLAVGGALSNYRRRRDPRAQFDASLERVNQALAAAHAQDRGWEPQALEAAARRAFEAERPGEAIHQQVLVQVLDRPGTDEDKAVFRFHTDRGEVQLTLGRSGGEWVSEAIS